MLKRHQILLTDWLTDYVKDVSEVHDLSNSEVVRGTLSNNIITTVAAHYPEFKPKITLREITNAFKKRLQSKHGEDKLHQIMSKVYFEARKAVELELSKADKEKLK